MPPFFHSCKVLSLNVACASNESLANAFFGLSFFLLSFFFFFTLPIIRFVGWNKSLTLRVKKRDSYLASKKKKKNAKDEENREKFSCFEDRGRGKIIPRNSVEKIEPKLHLFFPLFFPFFFFIVRLCPRDRISNRRVEIEQREYSRERGARNAW